jgi:SAM-dependent methyltransferase
MSGDDQLKVYKGLRDHSAARLGSLVARAARRLLPPNTLLNRVAAPIPTEALGSLNIPVERFRVDLDEMSEWGATYVPAVGNAFGSVRRKKTLELYMSFKILALNEQDVYLDAAGGRFSYAGSAAVRRAYLEDLRITQELRDELHGLVDLVEASADRIPLPDRSVDKISCHHSFEHFQRGADIGFIDEVKRLLAPGGRCVVVPILIAERHVLATDLFGFRFWSESGIRVRDPTATLPGGEACGSFARIYSPGSFRERILNRIGNGSEFSARICCATAGQAAELPGADGAVGPVGSHVNRYYRALVIDRAR